MRSIDMFCNKFIWNSLLFDRQLHFHRVESKNHYRWVMVFNDKNVVLFSFSVKSLFLIPLFFCGIYLIDWLFLEMSENFKNSLLSSSVWSWLEAVLYVLLKDICLILDIVLILSRNTNQQCSRDLNRVYKRFLFLSDYPSCCVLTVA